MREQGERSALTLSGRGIRTSLWEQLHRHVAPEPDAKGEVCAPALPRLDRAKAAAAAKAAGVEPENLRVASVAIPLRAKPAAVAEAISQLDPGDLAPVVTDLTQNTPSGWNAIAMTDGAIGYTDAVGLDELTPGAICWAKDKGGWKIVSTIQRGG